MKFFAMFLLIATLAACEGTTTGRKSECFGDQKPDGNYAVTRGETNHYTLSTKNTRGGGRYECAYKDL